VGLLVPFEGTTPYVGFWVLADGSTSFAMR